MINNPQPETSNLENNPDWQIFQTEVNAMLGKFKRLSKKCQLTLLEIIDQQTNLVPKKDNKLRDLFASFRRLFELEVKND